MASPSIPWKLELKASHEMFGLNYVIFRPHNVYGERQNIGDRYRNVVGIFMNQLLQGQSMTVFGDGEQKRAFTSITDVAPVIARCVTVPGATNQVFNIGANEPFSVNQLARIIARAMGVECRVKHLDPRKGGSRGLFPTTPRRTTSSARQKSVHWSRASS